ncbi:MAG TPA: GNAT family N-acetyltransferase [Verrucomicrobiae bacterium]|nr:GNAT family N-acetyltransferase [Verrucomicrobiae bacterium]
MITIRPATRADVPLLKEFICALAEYEKLRHECFVTQEKLERTLFGEKPAAEALIVFLDDEPAGFALFFQTYSTFLAQPGLYLEDLFVKPELRRRGVGQALFRKLAQIACERGCGRFEWSALDWNTPAIQFYERMGAKAMSEWTVFRLTGDALLRAAGK